jgi:crossover junction endodeoxyribonuclease RusA
MAYVFKLPLPPSVNRLYLNVRGRGRVKTKHYRTWRKAAGWELRAQMGMARLVLKGPIRVTIIAAKPDNRKRDLDNMAKALLDLLVENNVIADDSKVEKLMMEWTSGDMVGVSVTVEQIEVKHGAYDGTAYDKTDLGQGRGRDALARCKEEAQTDKQGRKDLRPADPVRPHKARVGKIAKLQADLAAGAVGPLSSPGCVGRNKPPH